MYGRGGWGPSWGDSPRRGEMAPGQRGKLAARSGWASRVVVTCLRLRAGWTNLRGDTRDGRGIPPRFTTHPYPGESRSLDLALIANPDDL